MTSIVAKVVNIDTVDNLNVVRFKYQDQTLSMMSLELRDSITIGAEVIIGIKPISVGIAKNFSGMMSFSNKLETTIRDIEKGTLLSALTLEMDTLLIESIISTSSLESMDLQIGDTVTAIIKASEIFIKEVL